METEIIDKGALGLLALGHRGVQAYRNKSWKGDPFPKRISKKRVMLIGWDAADWQIINPLLDSGKLPALESLINRGTIGNIATLDPPLSPILWTSIATGKRPYKHGILGFTEGSEDKKSLGPVTNKSRKVKAVWNILNESGLKTNVVGWWPSHPAEAINGIQVSNFYGKVSAGNSRESWPMSRGTVHPSEMHGTFKDLRFHPEELNVSHILPIVPEAHLIDQEKDNRLQHIVKYLCETISIQNAATYILEKEDWDFTAVYFDAIDHFSHVFMKFHPPMLKGVSKERYDIYKEVINGIYIFHDMLLQNLLNYTDDQTTVILLSDHGFYSDHRRFLHLPKEPAAIAREHNPLGVLITAGPEIQQDERIYGASLLDITPTLLQIFDLPVGNDMDGKVLTQILKNSNTEVKNIDSWESESTPSINLQKDLELDEDALRQLIDLGYIDADTTESTEQITRQLDEQDFYLARAYIDGSKHAEALNILESLVKKYPENLRYHRLRIECHIHQFDLEGLQKISTELTEQGDSTKNLVDYIAITLDMMTSNYKNAIKRLLEFEKNYGRSYATSKRMAKCYINTDKVDDAIERLNQLLVQNDTDKDTLYSLGIAYMKKRDYEEAASYFLDALSIFYHFPLAHYCLGECLYQMHRYEDAARAWEMCMQLFPRLIKVKHKLLDLYTNEFKDPVKADALSTSLKKAKSETIYIVSGLPRSGTSMVMQILEAGGMDLLCDDLRKSDENNKRGYYEFAPVKNLHKNADFVPLAANKVVKVVLPLLKFLPDNYNYKIILIRRPINEVLSSQYTMLNRLGKLRENTSNLMVEHTFRKCLNEIEALKGKVNFEILEVDYHTLVNKEINEYEKITAFLDLDLNTAEMHKIADPELHRSRS